MMLCNPIYNDVSPLRVSSYSSFQLRLALFFYVLMLTTAEDSVLCAGFSISIYIFAWLTFPSL